MTAPASVTSSHEASSAAPMIMIAPTGARRDKTDHPALPMTIPDIVETATACHRAGADALHLHVRGADGQHSLDPGLYSEALQALSQALPDMPVQISTESAGQFDVQAQHHLLTTLQPDWASVSLRETARNPDLARAIFETCAAQGTILQHILYDATDAAILADWQAQGVLTDSESVILVLGRYDPGARSDPRELALLLASLPPVGRWMVCAFGQHEHECLAQAAALGGDLRVGFENSVTRPDGTLWPDMAASLTALRQTIGTN